LTRMLLVNSAKQVNIGFNLDNTEGRGGGVEPVLCCLNHN
jgi:hypothetical protein